MTVTREEVLWAYRILLGREPEGEHVMEDKLRLGSIAELRAAFLLSDEYHGANAAALPLVGRHVEPREIDVEVNVSAEEMRALQENVRREWRHFGETDPHWSVLTGDQFRADRIEETIEEFYRTGREHVETMLNPIRRSGLPAERFGRVLDFGCGVGRLSLALAPLADEVVGVDISPAHLRLAEERARNTGIGNARFEAIDGVDDLDRYAGRFDLVISFIVLQHNPPPVMAAIFRQLLAALAPGGIALMQVPTYIIGQRFRASDYLARTQPPMEMNALPQHEVFAIIEQAGCRALEVRQDVLMSMDLGLSHSFAILRPKAD